MKPRLLASCLLALCSVLSVSAATISGRWRAEFDTMIGVQTYVFEFKVEGEKLSGRAVGVRDGEKAEVAITEGRVKGETLAFVEQLNFKGMDLRITYEGRQVGPNELRLTRRVGDVATEELIAKRLPE
jgi:hypothetical protein